MLWALYLLKNRPNFRAMCKTMKQADKKSPTGKTLRKWVWRLIDKIVQLEDEVIVWENRIVDGVRRTKNISVDVAYCKFQ